MCFQRSPNLINLLLLPHSPLPIALTQRPNPPQPNRILLRVLLPHIRAQNLPEVELNIKAMLEDLIQQALQQFSRNSVGGICARFNDGVELDQDGLQPVHLFADVEDCRWGVVHILDNPDNVCADGKQA